MLLQLKKKEILRRSETDVAAVRDTSSDEAPARRCQHKRVGSAGSGNAI